MVMESWFDSPASFLLRQGDARKLVTELPNNSIDCIITSPPYYSQRRYDVDDSASVIGMESTSDEYVAELAELFQALRGKLKPSGSLWLNLGDKYVNKHLLGLPWRVALEIGSSWTLRNAVVWDQMRGTQSVKDRLRDSYEFIFHFTRSKSYYYDIDAIRNPPGQPTIKNGVVVSPTGVSGRRYRRQIQKSLLTDQEKRNALHALDEIIAEMRRGEVSDFRMIIRGVQRITHGNDEEISGRARELTERGFYILRVDAKGAVPTDVWRVVPESVNVHDTHYAVFPEQLLEIPITSTCPVGGVVLDPFCGTGSALSAAVSRGRRAIGFDLSDSYLKVAERRTALAANRAMSEFPLWC